MEGTRLHVTHSLTALRCPRVSVLTQALWGADKGSQGFSPMGGTGSRFCILFSSVAFLMTSTYYFFNLKKMLL